MCCLAESLLSKITFRMLTDLLFPLPGVKVHDLVYLTPRSLQVYFLLILSGTEHDQSTFTDSTLTANLSIFSFVYDHICSSSINILHAVIIVTIKPVHCKNRDICSTPCTYPPVPCPRIQRNYYLFHPFLNLFVQLLLLSSLFLAVSPFICKYWEQCETRAKFLLVVNKCPFKLKRGAYVKIEIPLKKRKNDQIW